MAQCAGMALALEKGAINDLKQRNTADEYASHYDNSA
jgi:hypothetical protein